MNKMLKCFVKTGPIELASASCKSGSSYLKNSAFLGQTNSSNYTKKPLRAFGSCLHWSLLAQKVVSGCLSLLSQRAGGQLVHPGTTPSALV